MSNKNPNTAGITKYWDPEADARCALLERIGSNGFPTVRAKMVDCFLESLMELVNSQRRTTFVGVGTFNWSPWKARLPNGRTVKTWHLSFKPCRYKEKFNGDR
jgi:nucleoid DNA-binding protein